MNTTEAPKVILNCQQGFFSIAKYCGGVKAYNTEYVYHYPEDALIRKDLIKLFKKYKKWDEFLTAIK